MHTLFVAMPEKNEQIAISKMIKAQDALLACKNWSLQKLQQLKQAIMSDLCTGNVRVIYNGNETVEAM